MYEVIHFFTDLQDFNHPYNVGDIFPRDGLNVTNERLNELSGSKNKQRKPLIKKIAESTDDETLPFSDDGITLESGVEKKKYTKTEIMRMNKAELQELAANTGVEGAYDMSGTELKEYLISVFGL